MIRRLTEGLRPVDLTVILFYTALTLLNLIFMHQVPQWALLCLMNAGVAGTAMLLARMHYRTGSTFWRYAHYWYVAPLILITFKELYFLIKPIRQVDYDQWLIAADRWLLGTDPTHALMAIASPLLTEILQIVYALFYFLPMLLYVTLSKEKKYGEVEYMVFSVIYGFFVSYVGYFMLPAIGPRFTLHEFAQTNTELPGLWLTNFLREMVNTGESIPAGTLDPAAAVQRDVFPSGHTMITAIVMYLSWTYRSSSRYFIVVTGTLLIFSTVYLRYHYVVDVIAGLVFMAFSLWSGRFVFNRMASALRCGGTFHNPEVLTGNER